MHIDSDDRHPDWESCLVHCGCGAEGTTACDAATAIAMWNRRTPHAPAQSQLDALREEVARLTKERDEIGDPWISCLDRVPQGREPVIVISQGWNKPKVLSYEIRMLKDGPWGRFIDNDTGRWYWYPERMHWMHLPDYEDLAAKE